MCSFITHIMSIVDTIVLLLYWSNHAMRQYASCMIKDNQRMEDKGWIPSSQTSHNTEGDGWKDSSEQWPLTGTDCSLIFSVSGDKCQARLNCYANTDSQIIPILVPSPSPSIIHQYHHPTDYIIKASHTEGWGGKESWKNCGVYLRLVIAEIQCNGAIDWHINQYLFAAAATYLGRDESFCFGLCL